MLAGLLGPSCALGPAARSHREGRLGPFPSYHPSSLPPTQSHRVHSLPRTRTWALMPTKAAAATMRLKARMVVGGWGVVGCVGGVEGRRPTPSGVSQEYREANGPAGLGTVRGSGGRRWASPRPTAGSTGATALGSVLGLWCGVGGLVCVGGSRAPCVPWVVAKC